MFRTQNLVSSQACDAVLNFPYVLLEFLEESDEMHKKTGLSCLSYLIENSKVIINKCEICSSNENIETHHIEWQKDWINEQLDKKLSLKMNARSNLVPLCKECHDKVDCNEIIVKGWIETSNGVKLEHYNSSKFNSKIKGIEKNKADEIIKFIKTCGLIDYKIIKIKILEKFGDKITLGMIKKFI